MNVTRASSSSNTQYHGLSEMVKDGADNCNLHHVDVSNAKILENRNDSLNINLMWQTFKRLAELPAVNGILGISDGAVESMTPVEQGDRFLHFLQNADYPDIVKETLVTDD
jgi:hypothetical protein